MSDHKNKKDEILYDHNNDGIDRRGFLKCMAWAGTGVIWTLATSGIPSSRVFGQAMPKKAGKPGGSDLHFLQISDSHMGFNKPANPDVAGTLQAVVDKVNALPDAPEFMIHTGDITHSSKPEEFDTTVQILKGAHTKEIFYVPGEHDTSIDDGKEYLGRFGKGTQGTGWYSFNHKGVHLIGLNNVTQTEGMGKIGDEQLEWMEHDLKGISSSTPVVVFAHIPLWSIYPDWGWSTSDSERALSYLKRFGSVTILNGHIHQIMQKVEGNVSFHTAMSTAFPQPAPGSAPAPGPLKVPAERLRSVLGLTDVHYIAQRHSLAVVDSSLATAGDAAPGTSELISPGLFRPEVG